MCVCVCVCVLCVCVCVCVVCVCVCVCVVCVCVCVWGGGGGGGGGGEYGVCDKTMAIKQLKRFHFQSSHYWAGNETGQLLVLHVTCDNSH